jgi:penicillin amidase
MKPRVSIRRDANGVPHVEADSLPDLCWGQGHAHATDRGMQMLLMRIVGQGRFSEVLDSSDEALEIDRFFRQANWAGETQPQIDALTGEARTCLTSYCDGVNDVLLKKRPWEFKLLRYRPEPWRIDDSLLLARMSSYLTMQQAQAEMERLVVEMIQGGVTRDQLEELFPGQLDGLEIELLKEVRLSTRIVPASILWGAAVPRMSASNNWIVAGSRTTSGKPLLASDIHLEGNRLPNVWYEIVLQGPDRYAMGGSIPGGPGIVVGRNPDVAWCPTYAFMDSVDSWIEQCKEGKFFREPDEWQPFRQRREIVLRKKKSPAEFTFYENDHGVLDGDPHTEGLYLATQWSGAQSGGETLQRILEMWSVSSVDEGMQTLGKLESCWNFLLVDRQGNLGYQMSGLMPVRRDGASGLIPLPGWQAMNDWNGFVPHEQLPRLLNPKEGFFATANEDLNRYGEANPINLSMGRYRADRISDLLRKGESYTVDDMFRMHFDVYSRQAECFMEILRPVLPRTEQGRILSDWDYCYSSGSAGAFLFEQFYRGLFTEVFGKGGLGKDVVSHLAEETGVLVDFYTNFDRILLAEQSVWFGDRTREQIYRHVATESLDVQVRTWGEVQQYVMKHLLLGGKLPRWLGFDRGPVTAIGGRATIHQGQIYRSAGRVTTFVPSFRLVTDMAGDECFTTLQGGPSDRRFSRWYCSDLENWRSGKYKVLSLDSGRQT